MQQVGRNYSVWCVVALGTLAIGVLGWQLGAAPALANPLVPPTAANTGLITHVFPIPDNYTQVIVIDPVQRRMAVYFVTSGSGEIRLKSVRNLQGDLQMQEFNSRDPSPLDIQNIQERNK